MDKNHLSTPISENIFSTYPISLTYKYYDNTKILFQAVTLHAAQFPEVDYYSLVKLVTNVIHSVSFFNIPSQNNIRKLSGAS